MRVLVLTFYFRPDLSAGSFRATALVEALRRVAPTGLEIDVLTTSPNRYKSYSAEAPETEAHPGVRITRIPLPTHASGMVDQSSAFLTFARAAMRHVSPRDYDLVFATSSRLLTGALGALIARRKKARFYLDMRDIFVDNLRHIAPWGTATVLRRMFSALERCTVGTAWKVNLVSPGFGPYFENRYPAARLSYFTNGIDDEFVALAEKPPRPVGPRRGDQPLTILYAGNLGDGQGLHDVVPKLAARMGERARFRIIGDGGRRHALEEAVRRERATTVELLDPLGREDLLAEYDRADVLFLHLNDYASLETVLPSKLFEYAALGKPLWAGLSGYAAEFVMAEISNAAIFRPCDVVGALRAFETLTLGDSPRAEFVRKFSRARISEEMARDILETGPAGQS